VAALPNLAWIAAVVGIATYSMTLSVGASVLASAVTAALWAGGAGLLAAWRVEDEAVLHGNGGPAVRAGWSSRIIAAVPALLGGLSLFGSDPINDAERIAGVAVGVLFLWAAFYIFTGRFAARFRRFRRVLRASPGARQWILGLSLGGGLLLVFGLGGFISVQGLRDNGVTTTAEVVEVTHFKGASTYFLRYILEDATVVNCSTGDVLGAPERGDTIEVMYDHENPDTNCQSADYGTDFTMPVGFTAAGGTMFIAAVTVYGLARRTAA
jgi:hypothetical protein